MTGRERPAEPSLGRHRLTLALMGVGLAGFAVLFCLALVDLPGTGDVPHPDGNRSVAAALHQQTANTVGSITFDLRGFDTMGEEFILLAAAVGTILLLRRMSADDAERGVELHHGPREVFDAVRMVGVALLPASVLIGLYIVAHGALSPGGGFQGGVVLASGIHLAYLGGDYTVLERMRPTALFDITEAVGAGAYVVVGLLGLIVGGSFLANVLPLGSLGDLASAGTVPVLNVAVGLEVGSALVMLVAKFLDQALLVSSAEDGS